MYPGWGYAKIIPSNIQNDTPLVFVIRFEGSLKLQNENVLGTILAKPTKGEPRY